MLDSPGDRPNRYSTNKAMVWFSFLILLMMQLTQEIEIGNIQISVDTILSTSTYTFYVQRSNSAPTIPINSYFQLALPTQYAGRIALISGTRIDCSSAELGSVTLYCTFTGSSIRVNSAFLAPSNIKRYTLQVNNVKNPFPATDYGPFTATLFNSDGSIFQASTLPAQVTTKPVLSVCSISKYSNNIVYSRGSILIGYQSLYAQNWTGDYKMLVSMGKFYPQDPLSKNINPSIFGYSTLGSRDKYIFQINHTNSINISLLMPPSTKSVDNFIYIRAFVKDKGDIDYCYVSLSNCTANGLDINISSLSSQVQRQSNYSISILPNSPISSTDSLVVQFPSTYDLRHINSAMFTLGIFGTKTASKSANTLTFASLVLNFIQGRLIKFDLNRVINPFDNRPVKIKIRTLTKDNYPRDQSTYSLVIQNGNLSINTLTCTNYQIGYKTACKLNFTLANSIRTDSQIIIGLPGNSWMLSQSGSNIQCATQSSSSQLKSQFQCRYYDQKFVFSKFSNDVNSTISPFTAVVNIQKSSIDIDHRMQLPWDVSIFTFSLKSFSSDGYVIDSGAFYLSTIKRQLFQSDNNSLVFQANQTMSPSKIYVTYNLPYDKGVSYNMRIYLPLDLTVNSQSIITSYGNIISYDTSTSYLTLKLTDTTPISQNITITGFKTPVSTKPQIYTMQLLYQNIKYFYISSTVSIPSPKNIYKLLLSESSLIVYAINQITLTISELQNGDILTYTTDDYPEYFSSNQPACSNSTVTCNIDGSIKVLAANNADSGLKLTRLTFNIRNSPFVGNSNFRLTIYDSTKNYLKQRGNFLLQVTSTNNLPSTSITYTSTNPYFNESTTLILSINLQIPNATKITINLPSDYKYISGKCIKNCYSMTFETMANLLSASLSNGLDIIIEISAINPMDFTQLIDITTKDNLDRNKDFGTLKIQPKCDNPCRSCSPSNPSQCLSCYSFNQNKTLSNSKCLKQCNQDQYQTIQSNLHYCKNCPISCQTCTSESVCKKCKNQYIFFNFTCLSSCPSKFYSLKDITTNITQCKQCFNTCLQCSGSATICSKCKSGYYLYQNSCRTDCPAEWHTFSGQCVKCNLNCVLCQNQTAFCLTCALGYYLYQGNCVLNCPVAGYVKNITSGNCQLCPAPCSVCGQFITQCARCRSNYFLFNSKCLITCTQIQGYYTNLPTQSCQICRQPCVNCLNSAFYCQSCIAGKFFYNHECFSECPQGSYASTENNSLVCVKCTWPCTKCPDQTTCSKCGIPYALKGSICVSYCGNDSFVNRDNQCQACSPQCQTCNITGCLTCTNTSNYLNGQRCVSTCQPLFKNQIIMICQGCHSPCQTCSSNSTTCRNCIKQYSLFQATEMCLKTCPQLYFSSSSYCKLCTERNQNCKQCNLIQDKTFVCKTCQESAFFYGDICVSECPQNNTVSNGVCLSQNCSNIPDCQTCSDMKCLSCRSLHTLNNGNCQFKVVSAISQLPVPFPFLILIVLTICSSFVLKVYFNKMYTPLYLYSLCGIFQAGCIALWTLLSILTSEVNLYQTPINFYFAALIIVFLYLFFNLLSFGLGLYFLRSDKKYLGWEKQDNKGCSMAIAALSLIVSFRFYLVKFSKLGNKEVFSATLQSKQKFSFLNIIAVSSIFFISIPALILSAYLTYIQTEMNYLFFTCLQMAVICVVMIVLSIMSVLTPNQYVLYQKDQYKKGYDSDNLEGKSVEELMHGFPVYEEEYHEALSLASMEKEVIKRNMQISVNQSVEDISMITDNNQKGLIQETGSYQNEANEQKAQTSFNYNRIESRIELDEIQVITSQIENTLKAKRQILECMIKGQNEETIEQVNEKFQSSQKFTSKPIGTIVRRLIKKFEECSQSSEDSDTGDQIQQGEQQQNQDLEMNSSKLLKGISYRQSERLKPKGHQGLSLQQKNNFNQEKIRIREQNLKDIQKIKKLVQQLAIQQQQEKVLKDKLKVLTNQLSSEQYIQLRQNIQKNNMQTQDKLSKLNQIYYQRKKQRDVQRKQNKIKRNLGERSSNKEYNRRYSKDNDFQYKPKQSKIQEIKPKKIMVASANKKASKLPQKIIVQTKDKSAKIDRPSKMPQKIVAQSKDKNPKIERPSKLSQRIVVQTRDRSPKIKRPFKMPQKIVVQAKNKSPNIERQLGRKQDILNIQSVQQKTVPTEQKRSLHGNNYLQPIIEEDREVKQYYSFLPIESSKKDKHIYSTQNIGPVIKDEQELHFGNSSEDRPDLSDEENQTYINRNVRLTSNQPLKQVVRDSKDSQEVETVKKVVEDSHEPEKIIFNDNQQWQMNQLQVLNQINEQKQEEQNVEKNTEIMRRQGINAKIENEDDRSPIDPQILQKISQIQDKAKSYLTSHKRQINLKNYTSQQLFNYNRSEEKLMQQSGLRSKYTEENQKDNLQKENSILYAQRQSEVDFNVQRGELLVFQDEEQIIDEQKSQQASHKPQRKEIVLNIQVGSRIPKRRVNRSVINLSPGKY